MRDSGQKSVRGKLNTAIQFAGAGRRRQSPLDAVLSGRSGRHAPL